MCSNQNREERRKEKSWNIYSSCDELPLRLFVEVYIGNKKALIKSGNVPEKELSRVANEIVLEYAGIIQSKGLSFEVETRNNLMNYNIRIVSLEAAEMLINVGKYDEAANILTLLKVKKNLTITEDNVTSVRKTITSELAYIKLMCDRLMKRVQSEKREEKPSKKKFFREIALVSQHFKMPIDLNIPASIYANYVKNMLDEIKQINHAQYNRNR